MNKLKLLTLGYNKMGELETGVFESQVNLRKLSLNNNILRQIDVNLFQKLTKLVELDLGYNEISELQVGLFKNQMTLKKLCLNNNKLKLINSDLFQSLTNLKELYLNNNELEEIFLGMFVNQRNLEYLYLNDNKLRDIDRCVFEPLLKMGILITVYNNCDKYDSFLNESKVVHNSDHSKLLNSIKINGFRIDWISFLDQFSKGRYF